MIQIFVEAVKTICKWLLNRIFDIFLTLLFLVSLLVPWRIYGNVKQLATHASNLRTFRESCATVFGWSVWDAVCCPMLLVELCSWRCPRMLYHTYQTSTRAYDHDLRICICVNFFLLLWDCVLMGVGAVLLLVPWRLRDIGRAIHTLGYEYVIEDKTAIKIYAPIHKNILLAYLDVVMMPFCVCILLTGFRVRPCYRDAIAKATTYEKQVVIMFHFSQLFIDVPCILLGTLTLCMVWRAKALADDLRQYWGVQTGDKDHRVARRRRLCVKHFFMTLRDYAALVSFCLTFPNIGRFFKIIFELRTQCSPSADSRPLAQITEVLPEFPTPGTAPVGTVARIFVKGTKPAELMFSSATLFLPASDNALFWNALQEQKGTIIVSLAKSFLPMSMCPKFVCAPDFRKGETTFQTTVKLPMLRDTFTDVLNSVKSRDPPIRMRIEFGDHEGTLIDISFRVADYHKALNTRSSIAHIVTDDGGKADPGSRLVDVFFSVVMAQVWESIKDVFAVVLFVTHVALPTRLWYAVQTTFASKESMRLRRTRRQIFYTIEACDKYREASVTAFTTACDRDVKPPASFLISPPRALGYSRYHILTQAAGRYVSFMERCKREFETLGEHALASTTHTMVSSHLQWQVGYLASMQSECMKRGIHDETSVAWANTQCRLRELNEVCRRHEVTLPAINETPEVPPSADAPTAECLHSLHVSRLEIEATLSASPFSSDNLSWERTRKIIFEASGQRTLDLFAVVCAVVVTCTVYRAVPLFLALCTRRNRHQLRKVCVQQFAEIFVDIWYLVKFCVVMGAMRHCVSLPMDLMVIVRYKAPAVIPLRQCIDGYAVWILDDTLYVISHIFRCRTYKYFFATAVWGVFVPAMSTVPLLRTNRKPIIISFAVCFVVVYYGWPFLVVYYAPHTSNAFLLTLGAISVCAMTITVSVAYSNSRNDVVPVTPIATTVASLDDLDISHQSYGGISQFIPLSWANAFVFFSMALEVAQVVALAVPSAQQYLLLPGDVGLVYSLVVVGLVYFLGSLPIVVVGIMEETGTFEASPWKAWALAMQLFSETSQVVVIYSLTRNLSLVTLLGIAVYVPLTLMRGHKFALGAAHHLELHFADLYTHVHTGLLQICVAVCATQPSTALVTVTIYSAAVALVSLTYNTVFRSPTALCPVAFVAVTRQATSVLQLSLCGVLWAPESVWAPCGWSFVALYATHLSGYAFHLHRSPAGQTLVTTVDELRIKLLSVEVFLRRNKGLSRKWHMRQNKWVAQTTSASRSDVLALQLLKLEKHISLSFEDPVFFHARERWVQEVTALISPEQRVRFSKIPCDRKDLFVYCRFLPYASRHFRTAYVVPFSFLPERTALEKVHVCIQSLLNTVESVGKAMGHTWVEPSVPDDVDAPCDDIHTPLKQ